MARPAILSLRILADEKDAVKGLDRTRKASGLLGKVIGGAALIGAGRALVGFGKDAIGAASDLQQSGGAIDTVFKGSADQMHAWAGEAATSVGLAKNEYNELGTLIGTQLRNGGTAMDELAPKTDNLIGLGADLSSMFGGDTKTAVEALSSALKGERDPIEKYGVSLTQASIDAKAAELGFSKVGGALSTEANQAATLALIMDQTADAHGNFAKESDTLAGQQQRAAAQWENITATVGTLFLPVLTTLFGFINTAVLPGLAGFAESLGAGGLAGAFGGLLGPIAELFTNLSPLSIIWQALLPVLPQVSDLLGLIAGTVGEVAGAIIPLVTSIAGAVIPLFTQLAATVLPVATETITVLVAALLPLVATVLSAVIPAIKALLPVVTTIFQGVLGVVVPVITAVADIIQGAVTLVTGLITGDWSKAWDGAKQMVSGAVRGVIGLITGLAGMLGSLIGGLATAVGGWFGDMWDRAVDAVSSGVQSVMDFVTALPGHIRDAITGRASSLLLGAGRTIIDGFLRGLRQSFDAVKNFVGGIGSWIANNKGPLSYDRKLLRPAGTAIMGGLVDSMRRAFPALVSVVGDVNAALATAGQVDPALSLATSGGGGRTHVTQNTVRVTVQGAIDKRGTAEQIERLVGGRLMAKGHRVRGERTW